MNGLLMSLLSLETGSPGITVVQCIFNGCYRLRQCRWCFQRRCWWACCGITD